MDQTQDSIIVSLADSQLWEKFAALTNEMILTKTGRCMFPLVKLILSGLEPNGMYKILLQFRQIGDNRYKYVNGEWRSGLYSVQYLEFTNELMGSNLEFRIYEFFKLIFIMISFSTSKLRKKNLFWPN